MRLPPRALSSGMQNLAMYVLLEAGHMVPADQPRRALHMLRHVMRDASAGPNGAGDHLQMVSS